MKIIDNKKEKAPATGDIIKVKHSCSTAFYYEYDYYLIAERWIETESTWEYMFVNIRTGNCFFDKTNNIDKAIKSIFSQNYEIIDSKDVELVIRK
jgi:hypothetical protein